MKAKILKTVRKKARNTARIESISWEYNPWRITGYSASVGYGSKEDERDYKDILSYGMTSKEFDRLVEIRYWELHRTEYLNKYNHKRQIRC
ncbi:MAG: hypothetical protein MJZ30_09970 [Paludibacteraceae bacterium]|nr:hypothetical protein [Paludibacteraceae bacterium]